MVLNNDNVHSSSYVELVAKRQWPFVLASDNFTILHLPPSCNQTDCTKSVKSVNQWIPSPKKNNNMGSRKPDLTRSVFPTSKPRKLLSKPRGQLDPGTKQGITKTKKKTDTAIVTSWFVHRIPDIPDAKFQLNGYFTRDQAFTLITRVFHSATLLNRRIACPRIFGQTPVDGYNTLANKHPGFQSPAP